MRQGLSTRPSQAVGAASNINRVLGLPSGQYLLGAYGGAVTAGGISRSELLRMNANGTADNSFDPGSGPGTDSGSIYPEVQEFAAQPDGKVVITGRFSTFNNMPVPGMARLNTDGSIDTGFNVGTGFDVNSSGYSAGFAVALQPNGRVLLGGTFTNTGATGANNNLARVLANGQTDATFTNAAQPNDAVRSMLVQSDGRLVVAGSFTTIGGVASPGIAHLGAPSCRWSHPPPWPLAPPSGRYQPTRYCI